MSENELLIPSDEEVKTLIERLAEAEDALQAVAASQTETDAQWYKGTSSLLHEAQQALQVAKELHLVAVEAAPCGIIVHDQAGKIVVFNSQLEKITGYSRDEIPDVQTWLEKLYPDDDYRALVMKQRKTITVQEEPRVKEAIITRKDGEKRICQFTSRLLPSG